MLIDLGRIRIVVDRRNLIGGRRRVPHLIVPRIVTPEKSDMAIDTGSSLKEYDVTLPCQPAIQQILHLVELINL